MVLDTRGMWMFWEGKHRRSSRAYVEGTAQPHCSSGQDRVKLSDEDIVYVQRRIVYICGDDARMRGLSFFGDEGLGSRTLN